MRVRGVGGGIAHIWFWLRPQYTYRFSSLKTLNDEFSFQTAGENTCQSKTLQRLFLQLPPPFLQTFRILTYLCCSPNYVPSLSIQNPKHQKQKVDKISFLTRIRNLDLPLADDLTASHQSDQTIVRYCRKDIVPMKTQGLFLFLFFFLILIFIYFSVRLVQLRSSSLLVCFLKREMGDLVLDFYSFILAVGRSDWFLSVKVGKQFFARMFKDILLKGKKDILIHFDLNFLIVHD